MLQTVLQEALRQLESHQLSQLINTQAVNISPSSDHGPSGTIPSVSFSVTQPVSICPVPDTATPTTSRFISSTSGAIPVPQPSYNFHWNPKSLIGRKRKSSQSSSSAKCKEKKAATWTHTYVCLAKRDQVIIPNGQERAALQIAGLGEKTITVSRDADSQDMYDAIILDFPKLQQAGGFELLKIPDNGGKLLSIIEIPSTGYTASFLKPVARNAKLYIRPLQRNLSLEPCYNHHESLIGPPKENCLKCGKAIPIAELKSHISMCENSQNLGCSSEFFSTNQQEVFEDGVHFDPIEEVGVHMDPVVGTTCRSNDESNDHIVPSPVLYSNEDASLVSIIEELQCNMEGDTFEMVVSRPTVLENALRRMMKPSFDPLKRLKVIFDSENGFDTGGLKREFFCLIAKDIATKYLDSKGCFLHNALAYQDHVHKRLGILCSIAFIQDGPPLRLFAHSVYDFMCGIEPSQINVKISEVSDFLVQDFLLKVESMQDESSLKELLNDKDSILFECGYNKPICNVTLKDKGDVIQTIALHKVILSSLAELNQFCEGLSVLGVSHAMKKHPLLLSPFFCYDEDMQLTPDFIRNMFTEIHYSEHGSNERAREDQAYMYFIDYLDDCEVPSSEADETQVTLEKVLSFFTGATRIPPQGFVSVTLNFNSENDSPTASTCAVQLTLPTKYRSYYDFKRSLDTAFSMHGGFGLV